MERVKRLVCRRGRISCHQSGNKARKISAPAHREFPIDPLVTPYVETTIECDSPMAPLLFQLDRFQRKSLINRQLSVVNFQRHCGQARRKMPPAFLVSGADPTA